MLSVRERFPEFRLQAAISLEKGKEFKELTNKDFKGKWLVVFFWPMDFTFVCPTEIAEFGKRNGDFTDRDAKPGARSAYRVEAVRGERRGEPSNEAAVHA